MSQDTNVEAGNRIVATLPVTLAEGSAPLSSADIVGLLSDKNGLVEEITPTFDDDAGTVSFTITFTDDMRDYHTLRLDGDDNLGDLVAKSKRFFVIAASAQRPATP